MRKFQSMKVLYGALICSIFALVITGLASADALNVLPASNDLWDLSRANPITIIRSSETRTDFSVSKIFGSSDSLGTWTIFADGQPSGYVDFVEWRTPNPINLSNFNMWATRFDVQNRPTGLFSLYFSDDMGQTWTKFYEKDISNDYSPEIGIAELNVFSPSFLVPVQGKQYFRAEFVRCGPNSPYDGPVILEIDGFGKEVGSEISPSLPAIDTENYGVVFWNNIGGASLEFRIRVIDDDGITSSSHSAYVSYPGTVSPPGWTLYKLSYDYNESPTVAFFRGSHVLGTSYTVPNGDYTFNVIDPDGNIGQAIDHLVVNPLPPIPDNALTPSNYGKLISSSYDNVFIKRGSGPYVFYDDFSGSSLNTTLWKDKSSGGGTVTVVNGEANFLVQNALQTAICNLTVNQDASSVNGLQADARVDSIAGSGATIRIAGYFLSLDGRNIWTKISIGANSITYSSEIEYPGPATTYVKVSSGTLASGSMLGKTLRLKIDWDETTSILTYIAIIDGVEHSATYSPLGATGPPTVTDKRIDTRVQLITADTCPTITWPAVLGAKSYRLRIWENGGNNLLWTANLGGTSYKVPPGILKPNSGNYQYQVNAFDSSIQLDIDNASMPSSKYMNFYVGDKIVVTPYITFDNIGVNTFTDPEDETYLNFYIRVNDSDGVPGNIKRVKVILPGGTEKILSYDPGESGSKPYTGIYSGEYYGAILDGDYHFVVEDWDGNTHEAIETLTAAPIDSPIILYPQNGDVLDNTKLPISWNSVDGAVFYRVFIYDLNWRTVYAVSTQENQLTIPEGLLKEDTMYRARVVARREYNDQNIDNSSHSGRTTVAANVLTTPKTEGTGLPIIQSNGSGVYVWKYPGLRDSNPLYWLSFEAMVSDTDGVPANIESVTVKYPGENGRELKLFYNEAVTPTSAIYWNREPFSIPELIPSGLYTFTVTDFDGNTHFFTDSLVVNPLPLPANLSPANGEYVTGTTPIIDWDDVPGAVVYRVKVYKGPDANTNLIYESQLLYQSECTIPPGLLVEGLSYNYRVYAFREGPAVDLDNLSTSPFRTTESPQFTIVLNRDGDSDGLSNTVDTSPAGYSNDFTDGTTFGTILSRGGQHIKVSDVTTPFGVLMAADMSGAGDPAEVSVCGGGALFKMNAGDNLLVTCGSVTAKVLWGEIETKFISESNEVATATLEPGKGLSYDPKTTTFTAPPDNTAPVAVVINNEVISVGKGTATKIVRIDIKPGSADNKFNPNTQGALPVAIFGSSSLNVHDIVLESLRLQGLNVKVTGKKSSHFLAHYDDLNEDGIIDLVLQFEDSNNWENPGSDYAKLTGNLTNGMLIEGMDLIVIVH